MRARRRAWTLAADHGRLETSSMRGDLLRVAKQGSGRLHGRVPYFLPSSTDETTSFAGIDDRRMIAPAAQMMLLYSGRSSENDDFR